MFVVYPHSTSYTSLQNCKITYVCSLSPLHFLNLPTKLYIFLQFIRTPLPTPPYKIIHMFVVYPHSTSYAALQNCTCVCSLSALHFLHLTTKLYICFKFIRTPLPTPPYKIVQCTYAYSLSALHFLHLIQPLFNLTNLKKRMNKRENTRKNT